MCYRHDIDINHLKSEIIDVDWQNETIALKKDVKKWLNDNIGWLYWNTLLYLPRTESPSYFCHIRFMFETDAMAFKLRWM